MKPLLNIYGLTTQFGGKTILNGIDLKIFQGDFHLIIGPNGSGKTTLLRAILAMLPYKAGDIEIQGKSSHKLTPWQRARLIGYVPQTLELSFNMDVWSFLELARFAHEDTVPETESIIDQSLALTQTQHLREAFFNELSGGERQRVLIAAALAQNPSILILDEPGSSLDPSHRVELVRLLRALHEQKGLTILLVTHDWNEYAPLAPSIVALKMGKISFQCPSESLKDRLSDLYDCDFHHFLHDGIWLSLPNYACH